MFNKFSWNGSASQKYTADYGSQPLFIDKTGDLSRNSNAPFMMDAPGCSLIARPSSLSSDVQWDAKTTITTGRMIFNFSSASSGFIFNNDIIIGGGTSTAGMEFSGIKSLDATKNTTITIMKNGYFSAENFEEISDYNYFTLTENACLTLTPSKKTTTLPFTMSLSGSALSELRYSDVLVRGSDISVSDDATYILYADSIYPVNQRTFSIESGSAEICLIGNIQPVEIKNLDVPIFNFSTQNGTNNGHFILECTVNSIPLTSAFGKQVLLDSGLITVDDVVQKDDSRLNFEFNSIQTGLYNFMVISLKN